MVVAIVPGMGTVLEGAEKLEKEFSSLQETEGQEKKITFLPSSSSPSNNNGVLEELENMNALHIGLYKLLEQRLGIKFTGIIGLSASEPCGLAIASSSNAEDLETITKIYSDLYQQLEGKGNMLVVFDVSKEDILQAIAADATERGETSTTAGIGAWFGEKAGAITGSTKDMEKVQQLAISKGWKHLMPKVGYGDRIPFHCPELFEPHRSTTIQKLKDCSSGSGDADLTKKFSIPYYSSYTGGRVTALKEGFAEFLFNSMAEPALSFDAIRSCVRDGHRQFVELNLEPLYVRTVEEAFVAEGIPIQECQVYCCSPSKNEMEELAKKLKVTT